MAETYDWDDMAGIKPSLDRKTKQQKVVDGELQWRVIVHDRRTKKPVERLVAGLEEARRVRAQLRASLSAPPEQASAATGMTLNDWAPRFLRYYATRKDGLPRPATSMESATQRLELYILPELGHREMASITLAELEDVVAGLKKKDGSPLAQSSKESVLNTIKTVWGTAKRRGAIPTNVAAELSTSWGGSAASSRRLIKPSLEAVEALATAMGDLADVVYLLAYTGMRWEEASGMWVTDVDFETRLLSCKRAAPVVRGKRVPPGQTMKTRHAGRDILIVDQAVQPLLNLLERAKSLPLTAEPVLVTGERGRGPLHYGTWRNALRKAQAATGVTYTAHELRHVFASILIDAGMEDSKIARYMGHSNAAYTRRLYGHWFPQDGRDDAAELSAAIAAIKARESAIAERLQLGGK